VAMNVHYVGDNPDYQLRQSLLKRAGGDMPMPAKKPKSAMERYEELDVQDEPRTRAQQTEEGDGRAVFKRPDAPNAQQGDFRLSQPSERGQRNLIETISDLCGDSSPAHNTIVLINAIKSKNVDLRDLARNTAKLNTLMFGENAAACHTWDPLDDGTVRSFKKTSNCCDAVTQVGITVDYFNQAYAGLLNAQKEQLVPGSFSAAYGLGPAPQKEHDKDLVVVVARTTAVSPAWLGAMSALVRGHYLYVADVSPDKYPIDGYPIATGAVVPKGTAGAVEATVISTQNSQKESAKWVILKPNVKPALRPEAIEKLLQNALSLDQTMGWSSRLHGIAITSAAQSEWLRHKSIEVNGAQSHVKATGATWTDYR